MKPSHLLLIIPLAVLVSFTTYDANAAVFLKIDSIPGDVTVAGFENDIQLDSFHFGAGRSISSSGVGVPNLSDLKVTKLMDKSSPQFVHEALAGGNIPQIEIFLTKTENGQQFIFAQYIMKNVLVSGYSVSSGGDRPSEGISFNYATLETEFIPQNPDGSAGQPITFCWDNVLGKECTATFTPTDTVPPTTTATPSGKPGTSGWYTSDVTVAFSVSDNCCGTEVETTTYSLDSGSQTTYSGPIAVTGDGVHTLTFSSKDNSGNQEALNTLSIKIDTVAPTVTGTANIAANANGWYNHPVTITWSGTDATSGIGSCDSPTVYSGPDGSSISLTGHCTDNAGNVGTGTVTINYDSTPPAITAAKNPLPNTNGWNNSPVTVTFTCNDSLSGVDTCSSPAIVSTEGANQQVTGTATDKAGNSASITVNGINIDLTPPSVTGSVSRPPDHNGWYNHPVTETWTGTDTLSGIDFCDSSTNYAGPDGTSIVLAGHCTDKAGNVGSTTATIKYDSTPPTLNVPTDMTVFPTNPSGSTVSYPAATATDDEPTTVSCSPPSGSAFTFGPTPVSCMATDDAGNSASGSFMITVLTPAQATNKLISIVNGMSLQGGETNSLDAKLQAVLNSLNSHQNNAAKNQLKAFINEVNAQTGKKISQAQAAQLLTYANDIINSIS